MAAQHESHLAAPGVHEAGPAGVHGDILPIPSTKANRGVVKGLACQLQNCGHRKESRCQWMGQLNKAEKETPSQQLRSPGDRQGQRTGQGELTLLMDGQHEGSILRM